MLLGKHAVPLTPSLGGEAGDKGCVLRVVSASGAEERKAWAFESRGVGKRIASRLRGVAVEKARHFEK